MSGTSGIMMIGDGDWMVENARRMQRATERLIAALAARHAGADATFDGATETPLALAQLATRFGLSSFERDFLLLCAVRERSATHDTHVDFDLASAILAAPARVALSPCAALRRWRLVDLIPGRADGPARLGIDERVQFYLDGYSFLDARLEGLVRPASASPRSGGGMTDRIVASLRTAATPAECPIVELSGAEASERVGVFVAVCQQLRLRPYVVAASDIPAQPAEREALARLWEREAILLNGALLIVAEDLHGDNAERLRSFIDALEALVFVSCTARHQPFDRATLCCELAPREVPAEIDRWRTALGPLADRLNGSVERAAIQFRLDDQALISAAAAARAAATHDVAADALWDSARAHARRGLDSLAERIETKATWADLVLPPAQLEVLRTIAVHVRERHRVYQEWGFADKSTRGLGIAALFAGASGTGKTLAAEVLSNELKLDLYRVDLARLVSKYIGETEKNLARVFDAAAASGAIVLFDEADALFGKRSEVRDSHDRYANIEVSYLLQRIETYRGLSILTTNLKQAIDTAFLRRFRFVVQFPFPDVAARRQIWARIFPEALPSEALDSDKLARLGLSGGHIRNIALHAAFLAADRREPVRMSHLRDAAEAEYAKLEKALPRTDLRDWA